MLLALIVTGSLSQGVGTYKPGKNAQRLSLYNACPATETWIATERSRGSLMLLDGSSAASAQWQPWQGILNPLVLYWWRVGLAKQGDTKSHCLTCRMYGKCAPLSRLNEVSLVCPVCFPRLAALTFCSNWRCKNIWLLPPSSSSPQFFKFLQQSPITSHALWKKGGNPSR